MDYTLGLYQVVTLPHRAPEEGRKGVATKKKVSPNYHATEKNTNSRAGQERNLSDKP